MICSQCGWLQMDNYHRKKCPKCGGKIREPIDEETTENTDKEKGGEGTT